MTTGSTTGARSRALVCSHDTEANAVMESVFSSLTSYELQKNSLDALMKGDRIDSDTLDIVILDIEDGAILDDPEFNQVRNNLGKLPIIFISDTLSQDRVRQLIKLDGADWLSKPLHARTLIDTVSSITQRLKSGNNKVHAVLSCGGGSGGTSVAIMLAYYLSRNRKRTQPSAALIDLDFSKADVGAYLNIENEYQLDSIIGKSERVDLEFIDVIKEIHESGFSLFSFECPQMPFAETGPELVLKMLDLISFQNNHTILDMSSSVTPWQSKILSVVDTVTIVSGISLPSLQRAKHMHKQISKLRKSESGIHVVTNHVKSSLFGTQFGKKDLLKLFDASVLTILPEERDTMLEALNRGALPLEINKRSVFCSKLHELADILRE